MRLLSCFARPAQSAGGATDDDHSSDLLSRSVSDEGDASSRRGIGAPAPPPPPLPASSPVAAAPPAGFVPRSVAELHPEYAHAEPYHFTARTASAARLGLREHPTTATTTTTTTTMTMTPGGADGVASAREMQADLDSTAHISMARNEKRVAAVAAAAAAEAQAEAQAQADADADADADAEAAGATPTTRRAPGRKVELFEEDVQTNRAIARNGAGHTKKMTKKTKNNNNHTHKTGTATTPPSAKLPSSRALQSPPRAIKTTGVPPALDARGIGPTSVNKQKINAKMLSSPTYDEYDDDSLLQFRREDSPESSSLPAARSAAGARKGAAGADENDKLTLNYYAASRRADAAKAKDEGSGSLENTDKSSVQRYKVLSPRNSMSEEDDQPIRESVVQPFLDDDPGAMQRSSFSEQEDAAPAPYRPRLPLSAMPIKSALSASASKSLPRPITPSNSNDKGPGNSSYRKTVSFREDKPRAECSNRNELAKRRQSLAVRDALSQQIRGVPRSAMLAYVENDVDTDIEEGSQVGPYTDDWFDDMNNSHSSMISRDNSNSRDSFLATGQSVRSRARSTRSIRMPPQVQPGTAPPPPPPPPFQPERGHVRSIRAVPPPPDARTSFMKLKAQGALEASMIDLPPQESQ